MLTGFSHSQLVSLLWPKAGIMPCTIASSQVDTYDASPQPAAGIDTWDAGVALYRNLLILINVTSLTAGTLTVSLRDSKNAITTANGAASTYLVATLAAISAPGTYYAELIFTHVHKPATLARVVADADNIATRRYHSVRAIAAGGTAVCNVDLIYGFTERDFPAQDRTALDITWVAS